MATEKTTGNIYVNNFKKSDKQPDYTGFIDITKEQIEALIADGKAGKEVRLKVGMWEKPSKTDPNQNRFFVVAEAGSFKDEPATSGWGDKDTKKPWKGKSDVPF